MRTKEQKAAYDAKFKKEHYSRVVVDLKPETKKSWQDFSKTRGTTLTQTIVDGVETLMQQEQFDQFEQFEQFKKGERQ